MSEKNVHQLQWKQKNPDPTIYASRNAENQLSTTTGALGLSNNPASSSSALSSSAASLSSPSSSSHSTTGFGATASNNNNNGRYPIIVSGNNQQIVTSPGALANSTSSTGLQQQQQQLQHFHHIQHYQQQQQQQQPQQQQLHHPHHHPQNQHFELSKIMAVHSGSLSRLELPPTLGNHPVSSVITENVLSLIGMTGSGSTSGSNRSSDGVKTPDEEKFRKVQSLVESGISDHAKQQILQILDRISTLKPVERLLLYLRMPGETPETDPLRQPQNPLGTRSEINHTINWVRSHLDHDPKVSIPKQDVYNDYLAYCERSDIKPLSTADFGKVMKQVFPEIRPRRLGTRGHSRYCYAAMRKTTKLSPPQLPMLGGKASENTSGEVIESDTYGESWNMVRSWAEGLFNSKFENIKDLADHIGKGDYTASGAGSSRVLLQKKLLQRDAKEKRVYADSGPLKKRRRKKRKGSTSSESSTTARTSSIGSLHEPSRSGDEILGAHAIKQEILDSPNPQPRLPSGSAHMNICDLPESYDSQMHGHQMLPMNLATESDRSKGVGGALPVNSSAAKNLSKTIAELPPSVSLLPIDPQAVQLASVKEEIINDEYNPQNVICKKVQRAHLAKGILPTTSVSSSTITTAPSSGSLESQPIAPLVDLPPVAVSTYSMGPPAQITTTAMESAKLVSQVRARKQRLLQANADMYQQYDDQQRQSSSPLVDTVEIAEDKDVLPENLGLPRERVISICNMDKHELDGYLNTNDEENSQDQEAELLQYFQMGDAENNNNKAQQQQQQPPQQSNQQPNQSQHQLPLPQQTQSNLDASHPALSDLHNSNSAFEVPNKKKLLGGTGGSFPKDRDDITQLRNYLHHNFNKDASEKNNEALMEGTRADQKECIPLNNGNHYLMPSSIDIYNEGSASASLTIMSEKHLNQTASSSSTILARNAAVTSTPAPSTAQHQNVAVTTTMDPAIIPVDNYAPIPNNMRATQKRKINLNAMVPGPSSTQRRKNYTFYPISPNSTTNITPNNSSTVSGTSCTSSTSSVMPATMNKILFASPRLTASSVRTKPTLHKQQSLPAAEKDSILTANDPMIGANRNGCRNYNSVTSASAPPSPSILQEAMMFGKSYQSVTTPNAMGDYNNLLLSNHDYHQQNFTNSCSANKMLGGDQNSLECVLDQPPPHLMSESRSQSVPLHYRHSPAFNQTTSYTGYTSACSSAAQTPVPTQFTDFSDPSTILDIFSDASQSHETAIKIEDTTTSLLSGSVADILPPDYSRLPNSISGIVSRSVPSTPLPLQNMVDPFLGSKKHHHQQQQQHEAFTVQNKYSTKMYDISKSMPTTPITSNTATPSFRYSPEFNRDFLINGNTVESTPAYSRAPSVAAVATPNLSDSLLDDAREGGSNSLTDGMDDLGGFGEVSESIIEADILQMNNL